MARLVVGRRQDERLILNDNIIISVIKTRNGSARLCIDAPPEIAIRREELLRPEEVVAVERAARGGRS